MKLDLLQKCFARLALNNELMRLAMVAGGMSYPDLETAKLAALGIVDQFNRFDKSKLHSVTSICKIQYTVRIDCEIDDNAILRVRVQLTNLSAPGTFSYDESQITNNNDVSEYTTSITLPLWSGDQTGADMSRAVCGRMNLILGEPWNTAWTLAIEDVTQAERNKIARLRSEAEELEKELESFVKTG